MMSLIDKLLERRARAAAQTASRRGMLKTLGGVLVGASTVPLLPVARAEGGAARPVEEGTKSAKSAGISFWHGMGQRSLCCPPFGQRTSRDCDER